MKSFCSGSMASIIGIIVLALMLSITALTYTSSPKNWWSATILPHVCGSDPLTEPVLFTINSQYMNLSYDANAYWDNLITPNGGFIRQLDSEGIMMKHGISMFHHLHCLQMIRAEIQRLMHLEQHHDAQRGSKDERIKETVSDEAHWTHCIDYIRQVGGLSLLSSGPGWKGSYSDMEGIGNPVRRRRYDREA